MHFIGSLGKLGKKALPIAGAAAGFALSAGNPAGAAAGYYATKKIVEPIGGSLDGNLPVTPLPGPPTVDEAQKNTSELDRLKRRKGVLANIFGGSTSNGSPAVGKTTLGGT